MIKSIKVKNIKNSRKEKSVQVIINNKFYGNSPSGKSAGSHEAKRKGKYNVSRFIGKDFKEIDKFIKVRSMGADFSIALSIAAWKAQELKLGKHFPRLLGNVVGGGAHGGKTSIQEFLVSPKTKNIPDAIKINNRIHKEIGKKLRSGKNDEGAWKAKYDDLRTLDLVSEVAEKHGARVGVDIAASEFYKNRKYNYKLLREKFTPGEHVDFLKDVIRTYKLFYVEDPFHEDDFKHFKELKCKTKTLIVGDDLTVTNSVRLKKARTCINAIIIKPNQIGTVSKAFEAVRLAKKYKMKTIVSHRSGETMDPFIADFSVYTKANYIKCGIFGKEREIKLKRLKQIWRKV